MSVEKFIHNHAYDPEIGEHHHPGGHSFRQGLEQASNSFLEWQSQGDRY